MFRRCLNLALLLLALNVNAALVGPGAVTDVANLYRRGAASSLVSSNNLNSYLKFEDNLADSFGTSFTENNGVTYTAGKIGQAMIAVPGDNSDPCNPILPIYASHADDNRFDLTTDWTICLWFYVLDNAADQHLVSKSEGGDGYFMVLQGGNAFQMYSVSTLGGAESVTASTFGTPANNAWYFVAARKNSALDLQISVNGGAWNTQVMLGDTLVNSLQICVGASSSTVDWCNGYIDELSIWKRALSNGEVTQLYNAGAGERPQLP